MELCENGVDIVCDVAGCANLAKYTIKMDNLGIFQNVNICGDCLMSLYREISRVVLKEKKSRKDEKQN